MKALVIVLDGLYCGYLGCYGNEWIQTPNLDRVAAQSVVFDQHHADYPDPVGARHALRTGCHRFPVPDNIPSSAAPILNDLVRLFSERGVATAVVLDGGSPTLPDFVAGWQHVFHSTPVTDDPAGCLEATRQRAGDALDHFAPHEHWLVWLDLATLLPPWQIPAEYRDLYADEDDGAEVAEEEVDGEVCTKPWTGNLPEKIEPKDVTTFLRLQRTLACMVTFLDAGLGLLLDDLEERALLEDLMLVITSDYGFALGEHGAVAAAVPWLHEERTHLPLLIRLPGAAESGRRVFALTQPVDVLPTLLALFGVPAPAVHGFNLLPLCRGETESVRAYACSGLRAGASIEWALRTPRWALLLPIFQDVEDTPRPAQLYVKPDDRWEVNNVYQHHPELAQHLEETLSGFVEATRRPGPLQVPKLRDIETEIQQASPTNEDTPTPRGTES
jgi:arylsulfatase A-like enzyme